MAIPKLNKVAIKIYFVSFLFTDNFKSPNLKTNFAVHKNPIASQCFVITNVNTDKCVKTPMQRSFITCLESVRVCRSTTLFCLIPNSFAIYF